MYLCYLNNKNTIALIKFFPERCEVLVFYFCFGYIKCYIVDRLEYSK